MGDYISVKHSKKDFDKAIEILLNLEPNEDVFGWQVLDSTPETPINLNTLIDIGNYIIHDYINGIEDKNMKPLTLKVTSINNALIQMIIVGSDVYQRNYNTNTNLFDGDWQFFSDGVVIYKGTDEPLHPDLNTMWLKYGPGITPVLVKYNGTKWISVKSDHYMEDNIYDINKRKRSIIDYLQGELNKISVMINAESTANSTSKIFADTIIPNAVLAFGKNICLALAKRSDNLSLVLMKKILLI